MSPNQDSRRGVLWHSCSLGEWSREQVTHLLHSPFGNLFGCQARDLRQEPAVLLPEEMQAVGRVRGQGRHEYRLVEGLLEIQIRAWKRKQDKSEASFKEE